MKHQAPQSTDAPLAGLNGGPDGGAAGGPVVGPSAAPYPYTDAWYEIAQVRHDQVHTFGHTAEKDARRPLAAFGADLENAARAIREDIHFGKDHARIRRRLVKLAALTIAMIDTIDHRETTDV